jgi:hypothetical protein
MEAAAGAGQPPDCRLEAVLHDIDCWKTAQGQTGPAASEFKSRAAGEITPYLGRRAADRIVACTLPHDEDLLSRIESVLRLFLGEKTAAELTSRVVDASIVRF